MRELFLPFAQEVNRRLADCGFKLCSGGIMAGNPAWRLSLSEWKDRFADWVRVPEPQALLNASIFFDLRPLCGDLDLGESLRRRTTGAHCRGHGIFAPDGGQRPAGKATAQFQGRGGWQWR